MVDLSQLPHCSGVIHRQALLEWGYTDREIRTAVDAGGLIPVCRGSYALSGSGIGDSAARHRQRVRAVAERSADFVVSHVSAATIHRLPLWRVDTSKVHLTRPAGGGAARSAGRILHSAHLASSDVELIDGLRVTSVARTLIDFARTITFESAVIAADSALHRQLVTTEKLAAALSESGRRPGMRAARRALLFADGRAESPGESRTRIVLHRQGLPPPELQIDVFDEDGSLLGRSDLGYPEDAALIEFDGKQKYLKPFKVGMTASEVVEAERLREIAIIMTSAGITRVTWKELDPSAVVVRGILRAQAIGTASKAHGALTCTFQPRPPIRLPAG